MGRDAQETDRRSTGVGAWKFQRTRGGLIPAVLVGDRVEAAGPGSWSGRRRCPEGGEGDRSRGRRARRGGAGV